MVHSLLKSLFLYSALSASAALAAPAHQAQTDRLASGMVPQGHLQSPHSSPDGTNAYIPAAIDKRSSGHGPRAKKVTNAMRLANGLPPLAPRKLYNGSKANSANKARSSPGLPNSPPAIVASRPDGSSLGLYLSKELNQWGMYILTADCTKAIVNPQLSSGALTNPASSFWIWAFFFD
ncbi:hypothetical protein FRC01_010762 [Tulasnella sp. 417]|nr:hypothetical protein FRC01_010762 [Tulasnella sp. 417]